MTTESTSEAGERIYSRGYRAAYEHEHAGRFTAIDVTTGAAYLGDSAEGVLSTAQNVSRGPFHVIHIGSSMTRRMKTTASDWNVNA